jgi:hypothetical protein
MRLDVRVFANILSEIQSSEDLLSIQLSTSIRLRTGFSNWMMFLRG